MAFYDANKYLMGTPSIGNLDDDDDLEVVIGGYSSPSTTNQIFVINPDGTDVAGFPLVLGEKVKAGIALADFNENGKDDMVIGTDDDNLYLIYDDGIIANGFPFVGLDKFQAAPTIMELEGDKIIFSGCNDDNFYAVNDDGTLRFSILTGNGVFEPTEKLEFYIYKVSDVQAEDLKETFVLHLATKDCMSNETTRCQRKYQKLNIADHVKSILDDVLVTENYSDVNIEKTVENHENIDA